MVCAHAPVCERGTGERESLRDTVTVRHRDTGELLGLGLRCRRKETPDLAVCLAMSAFSTEGRQNDPQRARIDTLNSAVWLTTDTFATAVPRGAYLLRAPTHGATVG